MYTILTYLYDSVVCEGLKGTLIATVDRDSGYIDYIVEYENGSTFRMSIARRTIRESDDEAMVIAAEKQLTGEIPKGKISRVKRSV